MYYTIFQELEYIQRNANYTIAMLINKGLYYLTIHHLNKRYIRKYIVCNKKLDIQEIQTSLLILTY